MNHSLSIIIPTYNRAHVLARALESIYAQQTTSFIVNLQVIVIDDGSTDNTAQLLEEQYPEVEYYYQINQGVSAARNLGLKHVKCEWVALLDSDDEWLPTKLERQFSALHESELLVCHTDEIWIRNGVRVNQMKKHAKSGGWIFKKCLPLCAMSPSSIIINRSVFTDVGEFDAKLPACEDYDLWLRICAKYEVAFVEDKLINKYGGNEDQLSRQYWGMDRFRVVALEKILATKLSDTNFEAAKAMLIKKLQILLNGAKKNDNHELVKLCEIKLTTWQIECSM